MNRTLPNDEHVRAAMNTELEEAKTSGRRPTVTNVEKRLGIPHATFYRNYAQQVEWFKAQLAARRENTKSEPGDIERDDGLARLRQENTDLRKQLRIYAEAIRQLTLDKATLEDQIQDNARIHRLEDRRRNRDALTDNGHE